MVEEAFNRTPLVGTFSFFFFQAEDGIRDHCVTGVQTCALPISLGRLPCAAGVVSRRPLRGAATPRGRRRSELRPGRAVPPPRSGARVFARLPAHRARAGPGRARRPHSEAPWRASRRAAARALKSPLHALGRSPSSPPASRDARARRSLGLPVHA